MGRGKIVLVLVLAMLFTAGTAAAGGLDVTILPESGPHVSPDGTILVPQGADAFNSVGLAVSFGGFAPDNYYTINIIDKDNHLVYNTDGKLPTGTYVVPLHWVVPNDHTQTYEVWATGVGGTSVRLKLATSMAPIAPAPELSTVALMSAGMIGLLGLVRIQRRD